MSGNPQTPALAPQFPVHAADDEIVVLVSPLDEIAAIDVEVARLEARALDSTPFVTASLDLPMRLANRELIAALLLRRSRLSRQLEPR